MPQLPPVAPRNPAAVAYIREIFAPRGLTSLGLIAGAVFAAGLLAALCLLGLLQATASGVSAFSLDFGAMLSALFVFLGVSFGGGIVVDGNVDVGFMSASAAASVSAFPLGALAAVSAGVALVAKLRMRSETVPSPSTLFELARAAIEGAAIALLMTILTAFARFGGSSVFGGLQLHSRPAVVFLILLVLVTATLFLVRESQRRRLIAQTDGQLARAVREGGRALAVQGTVFGALALVALVVAAVRGDSFGMFIGLLPLLGNLAAASAALGHFGGVTLGSGIGAGGLAMAWDLVGGLSSIVFIVALLSLVMTAGVVGLRRPRTGKPEWNRVWQMPLVVFGVWCVLSLGLVGLSLSGSASSLGGAFGISGIGLSWSTPFLMGLAAGIASVAAEYVPLYAYGMSPKLLGVFGGKQAVNVWLYGAAAGTAVAATVAPVPGSPLAQPPVPGAPVPGAPVPGAPAVQAPTTQVPPIHDPMAGSPAVGIVPATQQPAPMSQKGKTGLIVTLSMAALLAVLGGGLAVTVNLLNQGRDPAAQVREYLDALAAGDADRANELVDPGLKTADRELLTNDTLASAQQRIEVVDVETTDRSDVGATVLASYSLDGERFEHEFHLEAGAKEMVVLDSWELSEPLLVETSLESDNLDVLTVGATDVSLDSDGDYAMTLKRTVYLYPGVYEVTAPESEFLSTSTEEFRAIPSSGSGYSGDRAIRIKATPNDAFQKEVLTQVQTRITQCTEIPTNMDRECPSITRDKDLAEMSVVKQAKEFDDISLDRFSTTAAEIAVRANPSSWNKNPDLKETTFRVDGKIEFVDGKPRIKDVAMNWAY